jgi:hypothetical protein
VFASIGPLYLTTFIIINNLFAGSKDKSSRDAKSLKSTSSRTSLGREDDATHSPHYHKDSALHRTSSRADDLNSSVPDLISPRGIFSIFIPNNKKSLETRVLMKCTF